MFIKNHEKYDHFSMAEKIAIHLRGSYPALTVNDPCFWAAGRYIGIFIDLVPNSVRMIIQLTESGMNRHVYNLTPMSLSNNQRENFSKFMEQNYPSINVMNNGSYAKLPAWQKLRVHNVDLEEISRQVKYALEFFD